MIPKNTLNCNFICYFACWLGVKADRSVEGEKEHVVCVLWVRVTILCRFVRIVMRTACFWERSAEDILVVKGSDWIKVCHEELHGLC
jgi:hypothetical protein